MMRVNFDTLGYWTYWLVENFLAPVEWETHVEIRKYWLQTWMEKEYMMVQEVVVVVEVVVGGMELQEPREE